MCQSYFKETVFPTNSFVWLSVFLHSERADSPGRHRQDAWCLYSQRWAEAVGFLGRNQASCQVGQAQDRGRCGASFLRRRSYYTVAET